jgi:hypothetical protein
MFYALDQENCAKIVQCPSKTTRPRDSLEKSLKFMRSDSALIDFRSWWFGITVISVRKKAFTFEDDQRCSLDADRRTYIGTTRQQIGVGIADCCGSSGSTFA